VDILVVLMYMYVYIQITHKIVFLRCKIYFLVFFLPVIRDFKYYTTAPFVSTHLVYSHKYIVVEMSASLRDRLVGMLTAELAGVSESAIRSRFGTDYEALVPILNELLGMNRIQLFTQASGDMIFKLVDEDKAAKLVGLTHEQILVYQEIEKAKNSAIWSGDIRKKLNIQTQSIDKTLKLLLNRGLIKLTRDVNRKNRKIYILSELEPAKEISGGPWYTDHEFDHEFVHVLSASIVKYVKDSGAVTATGIHDKVRKSGITNVNINPDEFSLLLQTLVYDGRLELARAGDSMGYKVCKQVSVPNYLSSSPCGICPVAMQCSENGTISPSACEYMASWLGTAGAELY
jgi:DNA-directed RNA polymerase III subunit RPC6